MAGMGAGYDLSVSTFSPDGRVFQVEYATKAVEAAGTAVGIVCKDGLLLAAEKLMTSPMLVEGTNRRVYAVDRHASIAFSGVPADARQLVNRAREEAQQYRRVYNTPISGHVLAERMGLFIHAYTIGWSVRPFGASILLGVKHPSQEKAEMYSLDPSGACFRYFGQALGKGRQFVKTEIERLDLKNMTVKEAVFSLALILLQSHEESKEYEFALEMSWISEGSNWQHQMVPDNLRREALRKAKRRIAEIQHG